MTDGPPPGPWEGWQPPPPPRRPGAAPYQPAPPPYQPAPPPYQPAPPPYQPAPPPYRSAPPPYQPAPPPYQPAPPPYQPAPPPYQPAPPPYQPAPPPYRPGPPPGPGGWGPPSYPPGPPPGQPGPWGGYGQLPWAQPAVKRTRLAPLLALLVVGLLVVGAAVAVVSRLATPTHEVHGCPPACGHPPAVRPVSDRPLFVGPGRSFSVRYDPTGGTIHSTTDKHGVTEVWRNLDGGVIRLFGAPAGHETAQQVAHDVVHRSFPDAERVYAVPRAVVGYRPGYGEVDDVYVQSGGGAATRDRLIVMVAVKGDVALVGEALGPYDPARPGGENDDGHPTGASLEIGLLFDPLINTFSWQGDPPH